MTILLLHNHYRIRGGEDSVFEAERDMLRAAGHSVETWEKHNDELQEHGGPIGKIRLFFRTLWNRDAYRELRERLARNRPDVVHVHNFFPQFSPSVFWACAKEKVPVVLTLHNYRLACLNGYLYRSPKSKVRNPKSEIRDPRFEIRDSKSEIKDSKSEIQDLKFEIRDLQSGICEKCLGKCPWPGVARRCYRDSLSASFTLAAMLLLHRALGTWRRKVDRFIALTEFSKEKFVEAGLPADKIVVKPNAVDVPSPATALAPHNGLRVIYIGRLSSEKGVDVLVRAWNLLRENAKPVPNAELWIVGDGPERDTLEHLASASPALPIRFFGAKPHAEALDLLRQSDLLVLPSVWYETFGLTVMEAAALGVPSVVSHGGIPASLIHDGETGRTFQMGNPTDLASVLLELFLSPKALARMGNAARNRYDICDCRPVANVARVVDLYQSSIENHSSIRLRS